MKYHPLERGFDEFYGFLGGAHSYLPGSKPQILRDTTPIDEKEYLTDAFAREAVAFIDRHQDEPFFLYLAFNAVHTPMHADRRRGWRSSRSIDDENRRTYAAMMSAMDDAVGAVIEKLRESEARREHAGVLHQRQRRPINGRHVDKRLRSTRRCAARSEPRSKAASACRSSSSGRPSCQRARCMISRSFSSISCRPRSPPRGSRPRPMRSSTASTSCRISPANKERSPHDALFWRFGRQMAIREGDWKLVRYDPVVDGEKGKATAAKLYNLAKDIGEKDDLMDKEPDKAKSLQAKWDDWNKSNVAPLWGDGKRQGRNAANATALESSIESPSDIDDD